MTHKPDRAALSEDQKCATCSHYGKLSPGHAAICFNKWKGLPWTAAVPLVRFDDTCDNYKFAGRAALGEQKR